jgi:hypothetical protein
VVGERFKYDENAEYHNEVIMMAKAQTTAKYRTMAWDAKENRNWKLAAKYYDLALKHYPTHHASSQMAVEDKAGLRRLRDEMRRNAKRR